jgi:hypothetical protein
MTQPSSELDYFRGLGAKASVLASVFTLGLTPSTESKDKGSVFTSYPTSTESQLADPINELRSGTSEWIFIPTSTESPSQSFGFEDQDVVAPAMTGNIMTELEEFRNLSQNWNGYGAPPIPNDVINLAKEVATRPEIAQRAPEVFPTGRETIQFEFITQDGNEAELEIFDRNDSILVVIPEEGEILEHRTTLQDSIDLLDELLA